MVMSSLLASMVSATKKHWDKTTVKGMRAKLETLQLSATPKSEREVVAAPAGVQIESNTVACMPHPDTMDALR
jgi:hypothetical protein